MRGPAADATVPPRRARAARGAGGALAILCTGLLLAACTAPGAQGGDGPAMRDAAAARGSADAGQATTPPARPPRMSAPLPPRRAPAPAAVDRSCRSDADCAVKDVGNCCGRQPACVNRDSPTDPAAVRAQCAKDGIASTCGFTEIAACTCSAGQCQAADAATPVAQ